MPKFLEVSDPAAARAVLGITSSSDGDIYNWRAENTRSVQRSIAKAIGEQASSHVIIGDSISQCYTGSLNYRAVWPWLLRNFLSARGVPLGGTGWVPTGNTFNFPVDPRYAVTGTWTHPNGDLLTSDSGATLTFTSDLPGTSVEIAYPSTGGVFTVSIDGGSPATITPSGGTLSLQKATYTGLADTTHTVVITRVSGTVKIYAVKVARSTGLQIHNLALIGIMAYDWAGENQTPRSRGWVANRLGITPEVVHIALGINDLHYSHTTSETVTNVESIISKWPDSDIVLWAEPAPNPANTGSNPSQVSDAMWDEYVDLLRDLATDIDCPLIDMHRRFGGSYSAASANGFMADGYHPTTTAHGDWGLLAANLITGGK